VAFLVSVFLPYGPFVYLDELNCLACHLPTPLTNLPTDRVRFNYLTWVPNLELSCQFVEFIVLLFLSGHALTYESDTNLLNWKEKRKLTSISVGRITDLRYLACFGGFGVWSV